MCYIACANLFLLSAAIWFIKRRRAAEAVEVTRPERPGQSPCIANHLAVLLRDSPRVVGGPWTIAEAEWPCEEIV